MEKITVSKELKPQPANKQVHTEHENKTDGVEKEESSRKQKTQNEILELEALDIEKEISLHKEVEIYGNHNLKSTNLQSLSSSCLKSKMKPKSLKRQKRLEKAENMKCYACGQSIMDEAHTKIKNESQN